MPKVYVLNPMRSVKFSNSDTMELVAIIKEKDHVCVDAFMEPSGIWLRSPNEETELRLLTLGDFQVTVSRVCFSHKRAGCVNNPTAKAGGLWCEPRA